MGKINEFVFVERSQTQVEGKGSALRYDGRASPRKRKPLRRIIRPCAGK
jgi:hypothetical protein